MTPQPYRALLDVVPPVRGRAAGRAPLPSRPKRAPTPAQVGVGAQQTTDVVSPRDVESMWKRFALDRGHSARNDLILAYQPLVRRIVARLPANVRTYWESDDLRSFGLLGLVDAINRWPSGSEPDRFAAYATKRIRGSVYDELRRLDWLPRAVRRTAIAYREEADTLSTSLGRTPDSGEILTEMGCDRAAGTKVLAAVHCAQLLYLDHAAPSDLADDSRCLADLVADDPELEPDACLLRKEQLTDLRGAITQLSQREQTVITTRYLGGLTQKQVALLLGVSNGRVCQIESGAIRSLRRLLAAADASPPSGATSAAS